jgi:hypothetical protein
MVRKNLEKEIETLKRELSEKNFEREKMALELEDIREEIKTYYEEGTPFPSILKTEYTNLEKLITDIDNVIVVKRKQLNLKERERIYGPGGAEATQDVLDELIDREREMDGDAKLIEARRIQHTEENDVFLERIIKHETGTRSMRSPTKSKSTKTSSHEDRDRERMKE